MRGVEKVKMKVVQINSVFGRGSTGKICLGIAEKLQENGIENRVLYSGIGVENLLGMKYTDNRYVKLNAFKSRILGNFGFNSIRETKDLLAMLEDISPEIVHIHNIHSHNCHFEMLLSYLREKHIKTVYTFHDCWGFTGYCTYFGVIKCEQWKIHCENCPQRQQYSWFFDQSAVLYEKKKAAFYGLDLTIVTPSKWLANIVSESFLADRPLKTIYNGIDLNIFRPTIMSINKFCKKEREKIVLGVADVWEYRKGLDVFIKLSKKLPENYRIILTGTTKDDDKLLPDNIISIHRTNNQHELAALYTFADVFVNPTREEVLGLTNIEANACGTPVVTFRTGGSPECIDETSGSIVECDDVDALEKEIIRICETHPYSQEDCIKRAKAFDQHDRFMEYVELYRELLC